MANRTYVIAEAGSSGGADLTRMLACVAAAAEAGADACKFQWVSRPQRMACRRNAPELSEVYLWLAWPAEWHADLARACKARGTDYVCSVYLPEDVPIVAPHVARLKVSSFECRDRALIDACLRADRPLIVSAGMTDTESLTGICERVHGKMVLLCTSAYPCPPSELHLRQISAWNLGGLSDHSCDVRTGALAVAAGARIVEVHFRLDDTPTSNPDYAHSLSPEDLREYISRIRHAEVALGIGSRRKQVQPSEQANTRFRVRGEE